MHEDNDACTAMGNAQKPTTRTRHMDIKYFLLCDWVERELMHLERVDTKINIGCQRHTGERSKACGRFTFTTPDRTSVSLKKATTATAAANEADTATGTAAAAASAAATATATECTWWAGWGWGTTSTHDTTSGRGVDDNVIRSHPGHALHFLCHTRRIGIF